MKELEIQVFGRVQGVNFRNNSATKAKSLNIRGYAKNLADGSVEIVAQGEEADLERFLDWCKKGDFPAKVEGLSYKWSDSKKERRGFAVLKEKSFLPDQLQSFTNLGKRVKRKVENKPVLFEKVPNHIVIIPDGNRRWARNRGWHPWVGHRLALAEDRLEKLFDCAVKHGVKYVSLWGFSTENWDRAEKEVEMLFRLYTDNAEKWKKTLVERNVRFRHFGREDRLPRGMMEKFYELEEVTKENAGLNFQFCVDYGGRDDIVRAFRKMMKDGVTEVTEETVSKYLDTGEIPDPDLIIRTSGEQRLSGIMAYQATYAELYFTKAKFPDFDIIEFEKALANYETRVRRFGGTAQEDLAYIDIDKLLDPEFRPA